MKTTPNQSSPSPASNLASVANVARAKHRLATMDVFSFDVFDTLISRNVATHVGIYALLKHEISRLFDVPLPSFFANDFIDIRIESQEYAHQLSEWPEVTLEEIYEAMGKRYPEVPSEQLNAIRAREESLEIEQCYGIRENIDRVFELRDAGQRVILISDTYFNRPTLQALLRQADPRLTELPLYMSSEVRMRKLDGDLFKHVFEKEGIEPGQLIHTGDNPHSDGRMARRQGARYLPYEASSLNEHEQAYFIEPKNLFFQLFAGASRRARLSCPPGSKPWMLGVTFTGPLFFGFIHRSIERAQKDGIRKLYFLARDGFLLHEIAKEIDAALKPDLSIRYIHISRQSLYFPTIFRLAEGDLDWVFRDTRKELSVEKVVRRLKLDPKQIEDHFGESLRKATGIDDPKRFLNAKERGALRAYLIGNRELARQIEAKAACQRQVVTDYLAQQGMLEGDPIALVDIGWLGTQQDAMYRILSHANPKIRLVEHYFGVSYYNQYASRSNSKTAYCLLPSGKPGLGPVFEILLQADHGTTLEHRRTPNGQVEPVLSDSAQQQIEWGVDDYAAGVREFSRLFASQLERYEPLTHYEGASSLLVERLLDADKTVAETLGSLLYSGGLEETELTPMAEPFTVSKALRYMVSPRSARGRMTQWYDGSYAQSSIPARIVLKCDPRDTARKLAKSIIDTRELREYKEALKNRLRPLRDRLRR